ncbi:MAG: phage portal protein, partial [Clostridiales bacterium]
DVVISERLKGFKFKIKPCSSEDFNGYCQECRIIDKKGKKMGFNEGKFSELMIINHTLYPDFTDAKAIKAAGCKTPREY